MIRHISALLKDTEEQGIQTEITRCRSEKWPADFLRCSADAPDIDTYGGRCMKLLFTDDGLNVGRIFEAGDTEARANAIPPAGEVDGDVVLYNSDERCGFLTRKRYPGEAAYVVCAQTVFAGPLTTPAEIEEVSQILLQQSRESHEMRMGLMKQWPKFRTVRVYDHTGRYQGTEVR